MTARKWLVDESVYEKTYQYISLLDYDIEFAEDRVQKVIEVLGQDSWLVDYVSSLGFINKQVKTKTDFLCDNDAFSSSMARIAEYIDFAKFNNQEDKDNGIERDVDKTVDASKVDSFAYVSDVEGATPVKDDYKTKVKKGKFKVQTKQMITDKDKEDFIEIARVCEVIQYLEVVLGNAKGVSKDQREAIQKQIIMEHGKTHLYQLKSLLKELRKEVLYMKDRLRVTIYMKNLEKGSTEINYDCDTGYMDKNSDCYCLVSENKIDFKNQKHIFAIIDNMYELNQLCADKPDSELWTILYDIKKLITASKDIKELEVDILLMKIEGYTRDEICEYINNTYGTSYTVKNISKIYRTDIPKKIANAYADLYEEWLYTYKIKGKYKTCTHCKEVKLATNKYFSLDKSNSDGLRVYCKPCDAIASKSSKKQMKKSVMRKR